MLELSTCAVDLATGEVRGGRGEPLTERERCLLAYLSARPGAVVSRDELLAEVWGYSAQVVTRAADNAVRRLREKIEADPSEPRHLLTSFGAGYRFEPLRRGEAPAGAAPRAELGPAAPRRRLVLADRVVDLDRGQVERPGAPAVALTANEVVLLDRLDRAAGGIVDRAALTRAVWGAGSQQARALDHALHRLRQKIEAEPDEPHHLRTVRGAGFRLHLEAPNAAGRVSTTLVQLALGDVDTDWDHDVDAAAVARTAHWLVGAAVGGVEVGDGWRFGFADPAAGLAFALAALDGAPRPAPLRVAVHRGRPIVWTDPVSGRVSAVGPEVHRVQELLRCAPGDAALVDVDVWAEVGAGTGRAAVPVPVGAVQIGGRVAPRPAGPGAPGPRLPWASGRYVGDPAGVAEVRARLAEGPAVTLVGLPGVGKSRLALEVCRDAPSPVHHVALGEARTVGAVLGPIAGALGVALRVGDPVEHLQEALAAAGPLWLWLDDVDLAIGAARDAVARWLVAVPTLRVLTTSRRALGIPGEVALEVPPLDEDAAVGMLLDRVPGADPHEARALVRTLDGLPLAIELAAARAATIPLPALTERMGDRLRLLRGAAPRAGSRHASMRAALDVSWDALDAHERRALAGCAAFRGGFDLDAAEAVLEPGEPDAPWAVDLVEALVRHHLLRVDADQYALPDSVAAYAAERAAEEPDRARRAELLHAQWYARMGAPEVRRAITRDPTGEALRRQVRSAPNLLVALERSLAAGDADRACRLALALGPIWLMRGPLAEAAGWLDRAAALPGASLRDRVAVRSLVAWLRSLAGDLHGARDALVAVVAEAEALGAHDPDVLEARLRHVRVSLLSDGAPAARPLLERLLADATAAGDDDVVCGALVDLGHHGAGPQQLPLLERAIALARRIGAAQIERSATRVFGIAVRQHGDVARGRVLLERALELNRRACDTRAEAMTLHALGNAWLDDPPRATAHLRAAERLAARLGERRIQLQCVGALAQLRYFAGDLDAAAQRYAEACELAQRLGSARDEVVFQSNLAVILAELGRPEAEARLREALARAVALELRPSAAYAAVALLRLVPAPDREPLLTIAGWIQDPRCVARVWLCKAEWSLEAGDGQAARHALEHAERLIAAPLVALDGPLRRAGVALAARLRDPARGAGAGSA